MDMPGIGSLSARILSVSPWYLRCEDDAHPIDRKESRSVALDGRFTESEEHKHDNKCNATKWQVFILFYFSFFTIFF